MKTSALTAFGTAILIALCLSSAGPARAQSAAEQAPVQPAIDAYTRAYESRDLDGVMKLFDPRLDKDVLDLRRKSFEEHFKEGPASIEFDVARIVEDGSAASVLLTVRERFPAAGENEPQERTRGQLVRFRNINGTWRIAEFAEEIEGEAFDPATRTYRSENGQYTLRIPEGWVPVEAPLEMAALTPDSFIIVGPDLESACILGFVQLPMKMTPEDGVHADVAATKHLTEDHRVLSEGPRTVGDLEGYESITEFSTTGDSVNRESRRRMRVYLANDPILYFFIFDAVPPEGFDDLRPAFDSIVSSFKVLPAEGDQTTAEKIGERFNEGTVHDRVYTSEEYNCFIAAPEGWEIRTSPNPAHLVEMKYTKGNSIARLLSTKGLDEAAGENESGGQDLLHRVFEQRLQAVKTLVEDFEEAARTDVMVEGVPGIQSIQTYTVEGLGKFHVKEVTVIRDGTYYLVLCQAIEPDSYTDLEADFDRIIASFGFIQ